MGLFGNRKQSKARLLQAAGMRIDVTDYDKMRALNLTKQDWQRDAWGYREMIGELRFAIQFLSRMVSQVRYFPAQIIADQDEPLPLTDDEDVTLRADLAQAAREEMERLPLDSGYGFLGVISENMSYTGEVWLHGWNQDGEERWEALSVDEVQLGVDGNVGIQYFGQAGVRPVDPNNEEMLRFWVPHPRYKILADSPMRSMLSVCEEIVLAGREMRAVSRSRFAMNGLLKVPEGLTLLNNTKEDRSNVDDDTFMADLTAAMLAPIGNEGDPGAVVPGIVTGNIDDLKGLEHMRFDREQAKDLLDRIDKLMGRLGRGLDIPPEIITGVADVNHWTAWQIDASAYRNHIDPSVRIVADSFTEGYLRPALIARGFSREEVKQVQVWYDSGRITENPNRGQDAINAWDRGAIGWESLRAALGFNDSDKPDEKEMVQMLSFKTGLDTATSGALLQMLAGLRLPDQTIQAPSERADQLPAAEGQVGATSPGNPQDATPSTGPQQLSAGATRLIQALVAQGGRQDDTGPDIIIDTDSGHRLMEIDRALRDRLLTGLDAALQRALERAGARLRSKAQRDKALKASLADVDVLEVGLVVGRAAMLALGTHEKELLEGALAGMRQKFTEWTDAAIEAVIRVVLGMLRIDHTSTVGQRLANTLRTRMSARAGKAWAFLDGALMRLAERYLFDPKPDQEPGEVSGTLVPPQLVRGALAIVGGYENIHEDGTAPDDGQPVGGIGLGPEVRETLTDNGAEEIGFEWAYGITPVRHFEPHLAIDGRRFSSWADPGLIPPPGYEWVGTRMQPGDHKGCMCDYVPAWAIKDYSRVLEQRLSDETEGARADRILAEMDDRAGRVGTTAQQSRDERERILALQERWIGKGSS